MSPLSRRWLTWLMLMVPLVTGCSPLRLPEVSPASRLFAQTTQTPPASPLSVVPVTAVIPLGWSAIERRVFRGVHQGVSSFRFGIADREDVLAIAMERAWRSFSAVEPIHNPEAWGKTIAVRVGLDELRRKKRDRVCLIAPGEPADLIELCATGTPSPFEVAVEDERRALLRQRIEAWPPTERQLALLLLDGHAETITAAAWLYREQEEARGEPGTMYPQKARVLLHARRHELQDLAQWT